jgi:hypothetical protein
VRAALLTAAVALLATAAPAHADTEVFVAYGEGSATCTITVKKRGMPPGMGGVRETTFEGSTKCSQPVEQTGHAIVPAGPSDPYDLDGGLCTGVQATCVSGGHQRDEGSWSADMEYHVTLRAPLGQGWVGAPSHCSGVGTDYLDCTYTVGSTLYYAYF